MEYDDFAQIQVLTDIVKAVRQRPGMYFGVVDSPRVSEHIVDELVSNVIDLFLRGQATTARVILDQPFIEVQDDGPGLPFLEQHEGMSLATYVLLNAHTTASAFNHTPHIHIHALHGVGLATLNAACAELHCSSWVNGERWVQSFHDGVLTRGPEVVERGDGHGSVIRLRISPEIFPITMPRREYIKKRLFQAAHLFSGIRLQFQNEQFYTTQGLAELAVFETSTTTSAKYQWADRPVFHLVHEDDDIRLEAAATGYAHDTTRWRTWINGRETPLHGTHKEAFERLLNAYQWTPNSAVLHLITKAPCFASPTTDKLMDTRADGIDSVIEPALKRYCDEHTP